MLAAVAEEALLEEAGLKAFNCPEARIRDYC